MLSLLPNPILIPLLVATGAAIGAAINWAIYSWCFFSWRPISPWMQADPSSGGNPLQRTWFDRIPVVGWFALQREAGIHGRGAWIRPLLIELTWAIGLPWFWFWQIDGGLVGGAAIPIGSGEMWFWGHTILLSLMFIATFIDFDEKMIPDEVTVSGTLIALVLAAIAPWFRLPELVPTLAGMKLQTISFASPAEMTDWHHSWVGLGLAIAILSMWVFALLPGRYTLRYGLVCGIKILLASIVRPARNTTCDIRTHRRQMLAPTRMMFVIGLVAVVAIAIAWATLPDTHWDSLFGSLLGLAFGGGLVWLIRIIASHAMQQEAMGFGDVTLMAMIGAFLGWQATLLAFAVAPFAALAVVFIQFLTTRDNELAFGPYLCIGALVVVFRWNGMWSGAANGIFFLGPWLVAILLFGLVLMAVMLVGIQWLKFLLGFEGAR